MNSPKDYQGHQKRKSQSDCHSQEEPKRTLWPSVIWFLGWDPDTKNRRRARRGRIKKNRKTLGKY